MSPKDKDPKYSKQDVVYHIPCSYPSCKSSYIGETGRVLEGRIKNHISDPNSSMKKHHMDTGHPLPKPEDKDIKIICVKSNPLKRKIIEAIYIQVNDRHLNCNIRKFKTKHDLT